MMNNTTGHKQITRPASAATKRKSDHSAFGMYSQDPGQKMKTDGKNITSQNQAGFY
jgi:hypothetical protein